MTSVLDIPPDQLTPGMMQYQEVKKQYPDCLVMLRMGDFFEMFYEDAITAARELEITLTARGKGDKKAPLAGIPYHALDPYLAKLVKKGYKIALVEQLEDPKKAKGLVKRGVVRIITPGTIIESSMLQEKENNYILSITTAGEEFALALCDVSTGEFLAIRAANETELQAELARYNPSECIMPRSLQVNQEIQSLFHKWNCCINALDDEHFRVEKARTLLLEQFHLQSLDALGLPQKENIAAAGALIYYLRETQKNNVDHLRRIMVANTTQTMLLDSSTLRNLELLHNIRDGTSRGSLLSVLDHTVTALGARLLRQWIKKPLLEMPRINARLDSVEELLKNVILREEIREILQKVQDLERFISRVNYGSATPREIVALRQSLQQIPLLKERLSGCHSELLQSIAAMADVHELTNVLSTAIDDDPPISVREGDIIKAGFNQELDQLRSITQNSKQYLQQLEERERAKTGISTLRIAYNNVFGYFIEITKKNLPLVPAHYIRKQTTANGERYITEELKVEEEKIMGAQEKIVELEYQLFQEVLRTISLNTTEIQEIAQRIAVLDTVTSFAKVALEQRYSRPLFTNDNVLHIRQGRHAVVEKLQEKFMANDIYLNEGEMMIITGPNMAGKSTIMRQAALIVLMAQMGSFVPAAEATLGISDRVFTRVGAYDDLSSGQSTFMVEMNETAMILTNATARSLVILDEIGRGTSTFDGVSIAWSVAEYLQNKVKAKTLFATHYHVLNKLTEKFPRIKNYNIAVKEVQGEVIFLHKLMAGGTDQSYGVHVAKLAGLPEEVVQRASEIQAILEKDDEMVRRIKARKLEEQKGLGEF